MTKPKLKNENLSPEKEEINIVSNEVDPFAIMERADENQILAELMGNFLNEFVYEFEQQGHKVTGLSLAGVRETVRYMNKEGIARISISDREPKVREEDDWIEVWVYAKDELNGGGSWGIKRQVKKYVSGKINEFALEQALSKAQRNAQRALIPENYVKQMIAKFKDQGQSKKLTGDSGKSEKLVTEKQLKRYYAMVKEAGENIDKADEWVKNTFKVEHKNDLTMAQIDEIFEILEKRIQEKKSTEKKVTEEALKQIFAMGKMLQIDEKDLNNKIKIRFKLNNVNEMTEVQANKLFKDLKVEIDKSNKEAETIDKKIAEEEKKEEKIEQPELT